MPKKTRKDKIRAEIHRHSENDVSISYQLPHPVISSPSTITSSPLLQGSIHDIVIRHDIVKTIILATIFIGVEIGLHVLSPKFGW